MLCMEMQNKAMPPIIGDKLATYSLPTKLAFTFTSSAALFYAGLQVSCATNSEEHLLCSQEQMGYTTFFASSLVTLLVAASTFME